MPITGSSPTKSFVRQVNVFTGSDAWSQLQASGRKILSEDQDHEANDHADAINTCLFKDGSNLNADIPMNSNKFTGVENASARDQFAAAGQVADSSLTYAGTSSGTDTITASVTPAITAYAAGQRFHFKAGGTNTGAATININSVAAKDIKKGPDGATVLAAGDITTGGMYTVEYNGTAFQLINPKTPVGYIVGADVQAYDELLNEIAALSTDPNADSGLFFDDSAGGMAYWTPTGALSFSGTNLTAASATDSQEGVLETATQAEMETGTATDKIVTPGRQHNHPGHPKLWAYVDAADGSPALLASYNVTSITDSGSGRLLVTVATDFANTSYAAICTFGKSSSGNVEYYYAANVLESTKAAGSFSCDALEDSIGLTDPDSYNIVCFGDQ